MASLSEVPDRTGPASVLRRLVDLGPPSEIRAHVPEIAAATLDMDRVLLSTVRHGLLVPEHLYTGTGAPADQELHDALREHPVALAYPLVEAEIMRRRSAQVVVGRRGYGEALGWGDYVAAPVLVDGHVIAFLHADRQLSCRTVEDADAEELEAFVLCFALVFERAVLRHRLRVQRQELRQIASWAETHGELGDRSIVLVDERDDQPDGQSAPAMQEELRDLLTRREVDVLELMVRGETNAGIARELVLSEGTVKFHVKNILRKLHAANRAEATSRYMRLTLHRDRGTPGRT